MPCPVCAGRCVRARLRMRDADVVTGSQAETEALGASLAASLSGGDVVYLTGDLGVGKTALARGIARGLGAPERDVASPTFALLHEYAGAGGTIVLRHLDLYRLADDPRELEALGLPESLSGAPLCVEWPGAAIRTLLPPTVEIVLEALPDDESRRIRVARRS
jgi:tRNA threonylcarbamoyladenosine biosynthesis protein TsaE